MSKLDALYFRMTEQEAGNPHRIHHFVKVHSFARMIAIGEKLTPHERYTLEAAALVHDIGIKPALEKYGFAAGDLQEKEGKRAAELLLHALDFDAQVVRRVAWLVAHHHTYDPVDGIDHQILIEADFLVNLHEGGADKDAIFAAYQAYFRTETGRELCRNLFLLD